MKPFSVHPASCSCTSCIYRSRSKEPKIQQIIQGGTDIDKLYYGKFLPLRERKLLEKLIRTRDVYDDVRNRLLSSTSSDLTSQEHKRKRRDELSTDKSSAVLKMVDLVDRGQMGSANTSKLHSCCSCCSCETLRKIRKRMEKDKPKLPRVHRHIVTCEDIAKYCAEAEEKGRKRRNKLSTKISSKLSSKIGAARLKMKKNLSEPCTCKLSLSSVATRSSKLYRKLLSKKKASESAQARKVVTNDQDTKIAKLPRKLRKKVKYIQSSTTKDSGTEVRSLKAFKIKKDSILLFKEKLLKKRTYEENQDVECEPGTCNTDECIPEECFRKVKAKGVGDMRKRKYHTRHSETRRNRSHISMSSRTEKVRVRYSQVQDGPIPKSSQTVTTILKTKTMPSFSKSEIKGKRHISPKQWQRFEKGTGKQDKAYKRTKSSASMTSIPKSKAKAQSAIKEEKVAPKVKPKAKLQVVGKDKRLEEKGIRVQLSPQSNMATCECKLSTKSSSSLTSVPKQKASKSHSKRIKSHELASLSTRHKRARQKSTLESYQNFMETDLQEPIEHVKAKKEKRTKPTHGRIKQHRKHKHSNTQFTGNLSKGSQESYLRDSGSQAKDLPFPRECEPLMCIPYECDPEKCAQIFNLSRSKSRGKSVMTSMDRLRRKSVGSAAFSQRTSQKTSSRSRTKSKDKQSKSAENFIRKSKYVSKEPPPQIVEKCYPDRQAVKITSSFSFDIEFYKDTYPCVNDDEKKDLVSGHEKKIKQKKHRRKYKDRGTGYISSRQNMSSESRSSQSFKNIQVGHRLKRCICTLKLLPKKKQKLIHVVSKRTMASLHNKEFDMGPRKKRTQTKASGIAYVVPPATSTQASLLPSKYEPDFCSPGECAERIKQRNRRAARHVSKDTNTTVTPKKSKLASTSQSVSKSTSNVEGSGDKSERQTNENRNIKHKGRHSPSLNVERKVSEKQAVRIGSNFNFNIEFSKTNINDQEGADTLKSDKSMKRQRRHFQDKGIKTNKPHVHHETSETNKYDKTKQTNTEPFLQRCLCTLKLLKKNKKKGETLSPWRNRNEYVMHMQKKSVTTNRAEIRYNPERSKLLPYEWEHGLCIPKEFDPYNCEKLIKLRHMLLQHKYSNLFSGDLGSRSTFSKTSRTVTSKPRNTQSFTKECHQKVKKRNQDYNEINIMPSHLKQRLMRIVSKSSLKMSHYKSKDNFITSENMIKKHTQNKDKIYSIGSQQLKYPAHENSIDAEAKPKEKGSYVFSAIKRCFSTLKFQKKRNKPGLENNDVICESIKTSYPLQNSQIYEYKSTRTKLSKNGLNSYKCAPNFCIPGMCDPHKCYEESKRREIKGLHDHYVSTDRRKRKSAMSLTTSDFSGTTMAKSTKSRLLKRKTKKDQKVRDKQRDINAAGSFLPSRQAARKGYNFSFNKRISKYRFMHRVEKNNTVSDISTVSRMTDKGMKNKRVALKHDLSKSNEIGIKASNAGFLLKRCFCTLGAQKKNKPNSEFCWHQPITTQFVQVEQNKHDIKKPGSKVLNKTLYGGEPLKLKLPEGDQHFRENLIGNQSAKHLPNGRSFSRRDHVRSRIEFNFDKMRSILNTKRFNPFYRSFYALNVKVSKSKKYISQNKYRALKDNERKPDESPPNKCDPVDCSKIAKLLKRRSRATDAISLDPRFSCYRKCKEEIAKQRKKGADKPITFGSDLSIRAGVYKDTDPYKSQRCQAIRLGSDVRLNFDFFKEPPSRGFCHTGPIPYHARKEADLQVNSETQSKVTGISHIIRRCFCASKLKNATKSDINQNRDVTRTVKDNPRYKSTTRLSFRKEKRESGLKSKSVQYNDYSQQHRKKSRRPTDRNNVSFCTNVNCVEFYNDRNQNKTKFNRAQSGGEGDVGKQKGPMAEKKNVMPKSKKKDKKKKLSKFIDKCYCTLKHLKGQKKGKYLTPKQSMEMIGKGSKKSKHLDEAERRMETIMPYSKKKFKKLDSQSKLGQGTNENTKQNQQEVCPFCRIHCQLITPDSKKKVKQLDGHSKVAQGTNENTEQNQPITPDSKIKVKKLHGRSKLAQGTNENTEQNQPITPDSKKKVKKLDGLSKLAQGTNENTEQNQPTTPDSKRKVKKFHGRSKLIQGTNENTEQNQPLTPDSKKKVNKFDGRSKLAKGTNENTKQNQPITPDSKRKINNLDGRSNTCFCPATGRFSKVKNIYMGKKKSVGSPTPILKRAQGLNQFTIRHLQGVCDTCKLQYSKNKIKNLAPGTGLCEKCRTPGKGSLNTCFCPKHSASFECLCYGDGHLKGQCPVCSAIATGRFSKTKNKLPCTCKDQYLGKTKSVGKGKKKEPKEPTKSVVDNTPLFEMTVNKTNMKIVNKDDVLKNLGSSGKESKAMKKARAAIKTGNVDAPVMEMIIDSGNASIMNSAQVLKQYNANISKKAKSVKARMALEPTSTSKTKKSGKEERKFAVKSHGSKCKCCICRGMTKGKKSPGAHLSMLTQKLRPCVCGSVLCKKDWDRIDHEQKSRAAVKVQKCVCGSTICAEESSKMPELLLEGARQAEREKALSNRAIRKKKLYKKERKRRAKERKRAFKNEQKNRKKQDKRDMKSVKKNKNVGDISIMAESLLDLGTFGSKAFCDIAGYVYRSIRYPRDTVHDVRKAIKKPEVAAKAIEKTVKGMGLFSTFDRIKRRLLKMPAAKAGVTKLEAYPTTNYLLHMADKDPKKRMKKFKAKRTREPFDFQCSVYMASMRKRPCLRIYYMCPWFYPHCMSLLNIWKQLMDILLFLLAVTVWSPCILCMELCRGCMCCCMCQG